MDTEAVPACPLCGAEKRAVLHEGLVDRLYGAPGVWRLHRCAACGAGYLDPRPTAEASAAAYTSYYTHELQQPQPRPRWRRALRNGYLNARYGYELRPASRLGRFVVPLLPRQRAAADRHVRALVRPRPGAHVLDVGCGSGEFLLELKAAGWVARGLDTDPRAVAGARERSLDVDEGELTPESYPPESFDAVTLNHVLEHLRDPAATLAVCRRILRRDGVLWVATPNLASPGHARYGRAWRGLEPPRHLVLFTPAALVAALRRAGFAHVRWQRPASGRWVYAASDRLSGRPSSRLAIALADARAARARERGEELVAAARPSR